MRSLSRPTADATRPEPASPAPHDVEGNLHGGPGEAALITASLLAEVAGKTRTSAWLLDCAAAHRGGTRWPPAPKYKGSVVHVDNPEPDLEQLDDAGLLELENVIAEHRRRRGQR